MALKQIAGTLAGSATEDNQLTAYGTVFVSGATAPGAFLTGTFLGRYGTLTLQASGEWQYVLANTDAAVQSLAAGTTVHELFGVSWTDGSDVTAGVIDIAVNGTNDVAVFSGDAERTLDVTAAAGVSGQMFAQDNDAGEKGFQASTMTGSVGTLTIDKSGAWQYDLLPGQQTAIADQHKAIVESFRVASTDGTLAQLLVYVTTNETTPPTVSSYAPADDATGVAIDENLVITFNEPIHRGSGSIVLKTAAGATVATYDAATSVNVSISGNTLTLDPTQDLAYGTSYVVEFSPGAVRDLAGNAYAGGSAYSFTTVPFGTTLVGNASADTLVGSALADDLRGADGSDTLTGGAGNDLLDGGSGLDMAVYSGDRASYLIAKTATGFKVSGPDGTDTLTNIERLQFADMYVAVDIDGNAGQAYRLYQAAFNRVPDVPGLGYQMHDLDIGVSLEQVAANFIASPEFQQTYGNVDNTQFITLLYHNVLHREPDPGGLQFHLDEFAHGDTRANMLIHFSESPENQANVIGVIEQGMAYTL